MIMASLVGDVVEFLTTADNWWGRTGIATRLGEHLRYSVSAIVASVVIALPIAVWLGHRRRFGTAAINIANIGRALPTFALIVLSLEIFGFDELPLAGPTTAFVALVALGIPPILINAYTGMAEVGDDVREAALGMGYTGPRQALRVELPNALPLILTGIRVSAVQIVATATLVAIVGVGGLGRYIIDGIATSDDVEILVGSVLVAALAVLTELIFTDHPPPDAQPRAAARADPVTARSPHPGEQGGCDGHRSPDKQRKRTHHAIHQPVAPPGAGAGAGPRGRRLRRRRRARSREPARPSGRPHPSPSSTTSCPRRPRPPRPSRRTRTTPTDRGHRAATRSAPPSSSVRSTSVAPSPRRRCRPVRSTWPYCSPPTPTSA